MTTQTQGLDVVQIVRHFKGGKGVDRADMVRVRGRGRNRDCTAAAVEAVADQGLPFEICTTGATPFRDAEIRFQFGVGLVGARARLIRLGTFHIIGRSRGLELGQRTGRVNTDRVALPIPAQAFGR